MKATLTQPRRKRHLRVPAASRLEPTRRLHKMLPQTAPTLALKTILVPTDFSPASLKAVQYALPFAEISGANVALLHVIEPASFLDGLDMLPLGLSGDTQVQRAKSELVSLARTKINPLLSVTSHVRIGHAAEEIVATARALAADLIVIATRGHIGLRRAFLGSTTERVVRAAPCPVLVVRKNEREFLCSHAKAEK